MNSNKLNTKRRRLEVQGFTGLDDYTLITVASWLRLATSLCALLGLAGMLLASPWILWTGVIVAIAGAIFTHHPFDLIYNVGIRHIIGTNVLPQRKAPQHFSCGVAALWFALMGVAFHVDAATIGNLLGVAFVFTSGLVSLTDICIPSIMYRLITTRSTQNVCVTCSGQ